MQRESVRTSVDDVQDEIAAELKDQTRIKEVEKQLTWRPAPPRSHEDFEPANRNPTHEKVLDPSAKLGKPSGKRTKMKMLQELVSDLANTAITASISIAKHTGKSWQEEGGIGSGMLVDNDTCIDDCMYNGIESQTCSSSEANSEYIGSSPHSMSDSESDTSSKESAKPFGADYRDNFADCETKQEWQEGPPKRIECKADEQELNESTPSLLTEMQPELQSKGQLDTITQRYSDLAGSRDQLEIIDELKMHEAISNSFGQAPGTSRMDELEYSDVLWDDGAMYQALLDQRGKFGPAMVSESDMNKEIVLTSTLVVL
ncbi:hypothetical protein GUITHDRAFT_122768 [Guillardia theta CCMP2712]|uniref:Uncharacterized protein n=1 Tax=Guillardia theta (strain CCMP2712) TaxID=905079 RepID=L1I5A0_GUITC|nr:hypothetical protein GUITHDRAFT_122768 [Guillardia theta CCMP2712]EKX31030.1 hypothetical protein GUITHDRAFT_122768 [Guillardia theta CCMP2712]|eukprot:XP_005818010.1 hypothetical protein GUITHDRAFT_122768 [Guillardia theta CCMP2712]